MDQFTIAVDIISIVLLPLIIMLTTRVLRTFQQSKRVVTDAHSLVSVIVDSLSARLEISESLVAGIRSSFETLTRRSLELENRQMSLQSSYEQVLVDLEERLSNEKKLVMELEEFKRKLAAFQDVGRVNTRISPTDGQNLREETMLVSLKPTERLTLELLAREGPMAAPELGRRLEKSREHTSRLMKNLYLEGYVDRESAHSPFMYKLNERVRLVLERSSGESTTAGVADEA